MGNALRFLGGKCCKPQEEEEPPIYCYYPPHGVTTSTARIPDLAQDILHFDVTAQVPNGLDRYVSSSREAQAVWYRRLLTVWNEVSSPPRDPEDIATLVILSLRRHRRVNIEGLLRYYGLPYIDGLVGISQSAPSSWPEGVTREFETLPVHRTCVTDGDDVTVYVDTANPMESANVPPEVQKAATKRASALSERNYTQAKAFHKKIIDAGYRMIQDPGKGEVLARKYRIRLRGIDAPESQMPYGKEAKAELLKLVQGKCLKVQVYNIDRYGRFVADIYCDNDNTFVQEVMLKKGCAWHYVAYDKRPEFAKWERQARKACRGLWALEDPEEPWQWRKDRRNRG